MNFDKSPSIQSARELRQRPTPPERRLWYLLRNRALHGLKFKRQQPIDSYVADFCCFEKRLVVELDGSIHDTKDQKDYDQERDEHLRSQGFQILRVSVEEEEEVILQKIRAIAGSPHPQIDAGISESLSRGGRGVDEIFRS